jgi:hypothetical protein
MESILSHAHKIIIDTKSGTGNTIYVPLDKLAEAIRNSAAQTAQPAPPAAPAVSGGTPAGAAADADDARSRERSQN